MALPTASIAALLLALGAGQAAAADPGMLQMPLGERVRMTYTPRPWQPDTLPPQDLAREQTRASLGLEFASPSKDGPRSLLRVQLSGDSALNFRPRGGGLSVQYRSRF